MIRPLQDRVLIRRVAAKQQTEGGLFIPGTAQKKSQEGIVVATGRGKWLAGGYFAEVSVKPGDRVLISNFSGADLNQENMILVREDDILAVLE
jgi:chaperonin GroES